MIEEIRAEVRAEVCRRYYERSKFRLKSDRNRRSLEWYYKNKERASANHSQWSKSNRVKVNAYESGRLSDPAWKMRRRLSSRLREIIVIYNGRKMAKRTMEIVGCNREVLRQWLESQFLPGMSWDNYGQFGWHVDHIKPCISFDLTNPDQIRACFHYTNLQPLWWDDNIRKGGRV